MTIEIKKSSTADTRTCDYSKVTKDELLKSSIQHINDVDKGMTYIINCLLYAREHHDRTKLSHIDDFYKDFKTGFKSTKWWEMHQKEERHHFNNKEYIQDNINLIDIIEQIVDGVMAGMARSGEYRYEPVDNELLQKAYKNTADMLIKQVRILGDNDVD